MRPLLIPPEFRLLVECCRRAFTADDGGRIERLTAAVDWNRFVRLARFHRVQGLAWTALQAGTVAVPDAVAGALSADSREIAAVNLGIAAEAGALRAAFDRAGIPLLFVKGVTLGALAYPTPMLKMGWDIDLLIAEADLAGAAGLLIRHGYRRTIPEAARDLARWHHRRKESVWSRPDEHLHVELHTRLSDNCRLIPAIGVGSPRREVAVAEGIALPTLARDELFAYLCVHGASSLWFRLKWITDLAALLSAEPPAEIERLYRRSQELGAGRSAIQALLLADDLYALLCDSDLGERLERDRAGRRLADAALRQLAGNADAREPTDVRFGTFAIHWTQLLLLPGPGFALGEAARQLRGG